MTPIHFGRSDRTLFGLFHEAAPGNSPAVLLCPPFGQEAIRAHRLYRVLSERLARSGSHVLRFDYFGTGDSMGEDHDGDLDGWCDDVLTAHCELVQRCRPSAVVWLGLRLGASVAAMAAQSAPPELRRLILCTPVIDGTAYLAELRARHVYEVERSLSLPPKPRPSEIAARDPISFTDEALGFALSPALRQQLAALRLDKVLQRSSVEAMWLRDATDVGTPAAVQSALAARARELPVEENVDWMVNTPENGTLIPPKLMMKLIECTELPQ
jgi:uncharacterized protein